MGWVEVVLSIVFELKGVFTGVKEVLDKGTSVNPGTKSVKCMDTFGEG